MKKHYLAILALVLAALMTFAAAAETAVTKASFRDWNSRDKYQYVQFGRYPQTKEGEVQPVLWRVLDAYDDGRALLLAEYVLDGHQVIEENDPKVKEKHTYRKIATIEESDLYAWMNTVMAPQMLTEEEQAALDVSRGIVFMPTDTELLRGDYGFSGSRYGEVKQRQCNCTDYAKEQGVYREGRCATYWCNNVKHPTDYKLQLVGVNGHLSYGGYTRDNVGIRPAILLQAGAVCFVSGSGTMNDPYILGLTDAE